MRVPPERIYGWLDSHLSIARFYGGINYQGHLYQVDLQDPQHPLVRADVLKAERRAGKAADRQRSRRTPAKTQPDFFGDPKP